MTVTNNEAIIAVMGGTGTGKSSFIHSLTGDQNILIGHGQESQTDQVVISVYEDSIKNYSVTLVDTPGFDDSRGVSDTEILQRIVDFLQSDGGQKLNGVIYLHRISDPRMGGNAKKNLRMFRELCGESALKNVCIATTNWSRVLTQEEGDMRERGLRESPNLFKPLIDAGAQFFRWNNLEPASAQSIVDSLIRNDKTKLQIQVELDEGKTLEETGAGSVLKEEMIALAEKHKVDMQALQKEIEEATKTKQAELLAELEEERQTTQGQMLKIQEDLNKLKHQKTQEQMPMIQEDLNMLNHQTTQGQMRETQEDLNMIYCFLLWQKIVQWFNYCFLHWQMIVQWLKTLNCTRNTAAGYNSLNPQKKNRCYCFLLWQKIVQWLKKTLNYT